MFFFLPIILIFLQLIRRFRTLDFLRALYMFSKCIAYFGLLAFQGENCLSRTLPALPACSFYGIQGSSQQGSSMLQQGPQPAYMGMTGYPNLYHTQVGGISREHQQLPSHGNLNGSQGQSSRQPRHLWQHSY